MLEHVPIARTRPATQTGLGERRNMLYKCLVYGQDSRFVTASGRVPASRGRGAPH